VQEEDPMSLKGLEEILERGAREPDFADKIKKDPKLLDQYDLTDQERKALLSGERDALEALGLEERMTNSLFRGKTWA
jgi:hypothetical protein